MTKLILLFAAVFLITGCNTKDVHANQQQLFCREDGAAFIAKGGLGSHTTLLRVKQLDSRCRSLVQTTEADND